MVGTADRRDQSSQEDPDFPVPDPYGFRRRGRTTEPQKWGELRSRRDPGTLSTYKYPTGREDLPLDVNLTRDH